MNSGAQTALQTSRRVDVSRHLSLVVLTELYLPTKGGTAVWFDEVYRRLGGKEIHIVTASVPGAEDHDRDHPNDVVRVRLERNPWLRPESLGMYARLVATALAITRRHEVCAIHAGRVLPEGLVALAVAKLRRIPVLIYAHGEEITTWRQPAKLRAMTYVYRHADQIIANSEFTRSELLKLGVEGGRIAIIRPGVDVGAFRPNLPSADLRARLGVALGQKLIFSVGRLTRRKGFDQVIQALAVLRAEGQDAVYALVGVGEDRDYLERTANEHNVADKVHFLGHVPTIELPRWYNAADVFAMPNRQIDGDNEGFGMVFVEAGACGKAAVAGKDGGTGDAVLNGITGVRVDGASRHEVTAALRRLLSDPILCRTLGEKARARAVTDFAWERIAVDTLALCDRMMKVKGGVAD